MSKMDDKKKVVLDLLVGRLTFADLLNGAVASPIIKSPLS